MTSITRLAIATVLTFMAFGAQAKTTKLNVSTINLKWYGIGGFMWNAPEMEFRQENLKQFIDQELGDSDVIVFSEVVRNEDLLDLVSDRMDCAIYDGGRPRHQHISRHGEDKLRR